MTYYKTGSHVQAVILALVLSSCAAPTHRITILHHNDFHSWNIPWKTARANGDSITIQGAAGLKGLADAVRDTCAPNIWLFAGDEFTGTPVSTLTLGASQIAIERKVSYSVAVLGNHEFDYGLMRAEAWRDSLGRSVLGGANLRYPDGRPFAKEFLDTTIGSVPMRIIGLVPPDLYELTASSATGSLTIWPSDSAVRRLLPPPDRLTVVLSHSGVDRDSLLALRVPEIDLIVGGHTHAVLKHPWLVGATHTWTDTIPPPVNGRLTGTLIVQAGAKGIFLGVLSLSVRKGDITAAAGRLLRNDGSKAPPDKDVADFAEAIDQNATAGLDKVIGQASAPMSREGRESVLGRWEADIFRTATKSDIAFQNKGGLRKDLNEGPITLRDIFEINPFGNTLSVFEVNGAELETILDFLAVSPPENLEASGLTATLDLQRRKAGDICVGGNPLNPAGTYQVATNSYIFGHFTECFGLPLGNRKCKDTGLLDRDTVSECVQSDPTVKAPLDERLHYIEAQQP
jgi:5'-nucleotidase / UDP-sugar diphosphatase